MPDHYVGFDAKHKLPFRRAGSGSQCGGADGPGLFAQAVADPSNSNQRFATDGRRWFRALPDHNPQEDGGMVWHGHPVEPRDVPTTVQRVFVARGVLRRTHQTKVIAT